jgi:hypothetical protein
MQLWLLTVYRRQKWYFVVTTYCAFECNMLESYGEKIKNIDENVMQKSAKLAGTNLGRMTSQKIREPNQSPNSSPSLRGGKIKNVLLVIGRNS